MEDMLGSAMKVLLAKRVSGEEEARLDSRRIVTTKRAICEALASLMSKRDLAEITVLDIQNAAGVSHSTFYRCFNDKYDVINWSFKHFMEILPQAEGEYRSFGSALRVQLRYLADRRDYFAHALRGKDEGYLRNHMFNAIEEYFAFCWGAACQETAPGFPAKAMFRYSAGGVTALLIQWLLDGCVEDCEEMAAAVEALIPESLASVLH